MCPACLALQTTAAADDGTTKVNPAVGKQEKQNTNG
jgi:hypothetical protein